MAHNQGRVGTGAWETWGVRGHDGRFGGCGGGDGGVIGVIVPRGRFGVGFWILGGWVWGAGGSGVF